MIRAALSCTMAVAWATVVAVFIPSARADSDSVPGLDTNGQCVGDADSDSAVAINELVTAVNNALGGCPRLPVTIDFRAVVGDRSFACGTVYDGIGTGSSQFIPADFRFYVSNVKLIRVDGRKTPLDLEQDGIWQYENVALLDFETGPDHGCNEGNAATNTALRGSVPAGVYTGLEFDLGLPFELNHGNASTAPSPLNFTAMFWSWNQGYKFLRIDTADDKFRAHIGSTGCDGGSPSRPPTTCARPNRSTITLAGFNPAENAVEADLAALLADNDIDVNQMNTAPGCQADPDDQDCAPLFRNLGLNFADGSPSPSTQRFFRVASAGGGEHVEIAIAATAEDGGALVAHPEFDVEDAIPLFFTECFGGSGDECAGGTRLFSAANPGLEPLEESEPDESLYAIADGTPITLAVTALDAGLSFRLGETTLDRAGATVLLGPIPDFHADLETQLTLPGGGEPSGTFSASLQLTTTDSRYRSSATITLRFTPTGANHD